MTPGRMQGPEPTEDDVEALAEVLTQLRKLTPDARARVLYAATSFFRTPQEQVTR